MVHNSNDQKPTGIHNGNGSVRLSREGIVGLALNIADAEGVEAVSFRRLANVFGVTPMAIYRHVRNKDDLLDAMTELMLASFDVSSVRVKDGMEQIRELLYALRRMLLVHPSGRILLSRRSLPSTNRLEIFEIAIDILRKVGFESREAFLIFELLLSQVISLVVTGAGYVQGSEEERRVWGSQLLKFYGGLPQQQYPRLVEVAPYIAACVDMDRHFQFGTDLLLAGVEAMAASKRSKE